MDLPKNEKLASKKSKEVALEMLYPNKKQEMKNIVFFTGAGISKESGIKTFRDGDDALWNNYDISTVATTDAWRDNPEFVLKFYNEMHKMINKFKPNEGHNLIASLEEDHDVTVITQNVDNLHELSGSEYILHIHGDMTKKRDLKTNEIEECLIDDDININDGYRPHVVWFGEYPYHMPEVDRHLQEADYLIIVGTSLEIGYVTPMLATVNKEAKVFFVNPEKVTYLDAFIKGVEYIEKSAGEGIKEIIEKENL